MIKIYPSRLEGEPIEIHPISESVLLTTWLSSKAEGFSLDKPQPICIDVAGEPLDLGLWSDFVVLPETDLCIYPEARAGAAVIGLSLIHI